MKAVFFSRTSARRCSRSRAGFTLIELMVVIALIGIVTAVMLPEMKGTYEDALLRSNSRKLIDAFSLAYSRAVGFNAPHRFRLDPNTGKYIIEKRVSEKGRQGFVPVRDVPGCEGELDTRIKIEFRRPPAAGPAAPSPSDAAEEEARGDETIVFYPDGTAEERAILLQDRAGFRLGLRLNPITARVRIMELERETPALVEQERSP